MKKKMKPFLSAIAVSLLLLTAAAGSGRARSSGPEFKEGYRGAVLMVDPHQLDGVRPGNYLDVIVTFDAKMDGGTEKVAATILQNVRVLSTRGGSVRVLLNPNEAQYAALAMEQGKIAIVTRAEGDNEMKPMEMASFRKLFK